MIGGVHHTKSGVGSPTPAVLRKCKRRPPGKVFYVWVEYIYKDSHNKNNCQHGMDFFFFGEADGMVFDAMNYNMREMRSNVFV